jgi:uncharacterized protein YigE (DUF2233 family)
MKKRVIILLLLIGIAALFFQFSSKSDSEFVTYSVNPKKSTVALYWKNEKQITFGSLKNLKAWLSNNNQELLFATNGGMYKKDQSPQGLYIENYVIKSPLDTMKGNGNFYLKPNGVFSITSDNKPDIVTTEEFKVSPKIKFATQSGPMLLIDGVIHKSFSQNSTNLNIRNGVGILPNNEIIFVMSKKEINFYDFATYFKNKGCKKALYLDGFVSRTYCPLQQCMQTDGNFGVIIGVTKKLN